MVQAKHALSVRHFPYITYMFQSETGVNVSNWKRARSLSADRDDSRHTVYIRTRSVGLEAGPCPQEVIGCWEAVMI